MTGRLHLHHADHLEPLLDALAEVLGPPPADPFTPDLVVVPAAGMRDAAMVGLGRRLGIAANVDFVFPGRFMARALGDTTLEGDPEGDPWRLPRLTWSVLEQLDAGAVRVPGMADDDPWSLARRIADLFDRYATQRPRLVAGWADGVDGDGTLRDDGLAVLLDESHRWQAELWRAVRASIGEPSPAERLPRLLQAVRDGEVTPQVPQRLAVFGIGALPPTTAQVLRVLAEQREVHVFLRHPSMAAWTSSPHRLAGALNTRANLDVTIAVRNPLLASWGRPSLEARALLHGLPDVDDIAHHLASEPAPTTLLHALQRSIQHDAVPAPAGVGVTDGSLLVHACHGEVRQLEALRDSLGHLFAADPSLQPHEVLVLCPDLERFAPLVPAVFARGSLPVPVRVGDRSLTTDEPVVDALQSVLTLVSGRATLSEVLALVQFEPVRRRFGWSIDDVEQLAGWCDTLGAKWGFSADHRQAWGLPNHVTTGTWRATVDQLLAGLAIAAPTPRLVVGDVAPFDDLSTDQFELVGSLADLLARLADLHEQVRDPRPVEQWIALLHDVVDEFCAADPDEPWRRQHVHRELTDVLRGANGCPVPISLVGVRAMLDDALSDRPGRLPLRSGAVTVSSMVPQHGVPARVVCLLGLDDGALRGGTFDGDDILGLRPCVGEPHPRHESRQLLLDAVLAAGDQLLITCNGADLTTNKEVPLIVPLVELLDVVGALVGGDGAGVVVRHPRHGFNERTLQPGALVPGSTQPFTFDTTMLQAAVARRTAQLGAPPPAVSPWLLPAEPLVSVEVERLVEVLANPSRTYLRERLEVTVPGESSVADDGLAITVDPLTASSLGRDLLQVRRRGGSADEWQAAAQLNGALPPGALNARALQEVRDEVEGIEATAARWGVPLVGGDEVLVDVECGVRVVGKVRGVVEGPDGPRVVDLRFTRPRPSFELAAAVQVAVLQLQQPSVRWSGVVVSRGESRGAAPFNVGVRVKGDGAERQQHAAAVVTMAVDLLALARHDVVPYFDRTSADLAAGAIGAMYASLESDQRDRFVSLLWPEVSVDALLADGRAEEVARWVWGTVHDSMDYFDHTGGAA